MIHTAGDCLPMFARSYLFAIVAMLLTACTNVHTAHDPAVDLTRFHCFYVERRLGDDRRLDEHIVQELRRLGYEASSGPLTMKPDGIDAVVAYTDRWAWDFKSYLIELNIEVRDARTDKLVTTGRYYQPSMKTHPPAAMIRKIFSRLFTTAAPPAKTSS